MSDKRLIKCNGLMDDVYEKQFDRDLKDPRYQAMMRESKKHLLDNIRFEVFVNKAFK